jgi:transcriptional regulator with XRE-family HTH domain
MNCVAKHLKKAGISQRAFAKRLEVSQPTVHAWVTGTAKPEGENIDRIADELGIRPEQVFLDFHSQHAAA